MSVAYRTHARDPVSSEPAPISDTWPSYADRISTLLSYGIVLLLAALVGYIRLLSKTITPKITFYVHGGDEKSPLDNALPASNLPPKRKLETIPCTSSSNAPRPRSFPEDGIRQLKLQHGTFRLIAIDAFHSMLMLLRNASELYLAVTLTLT